MHVTPHPQTNIQGSRPPQAPAPGKPENAGAGKPQNAGAGPALTGQSAPLTSGATAVNAQILASQADGEVTAVVVSAPGNSANSTAHIARTMMSTNAAFSDVPFGQIVSQVARGLLSAADAEPPAPAEVPAEGDAPVVEGDAPVVEGDAVAAEGDAAVVEGDATVTDPVVVEGALASSDDDALTIIEDSVVDGEAAATDEPVEAVVVETPEAGGTGEADATAVILDPATVDTIDVVSELIEALDDTADAA